MHMASTMIRPCNSAACQLDAASGVTHACTLKVIVFRLHAAANSLCQRCRTGELGEQGHLKSRKGSI